MGDIKLYQQVRNKIDTGDALLWKSNTLLGKLIRIWSPEYNHASFVFNEFKEEKLEQGMIVRQWHRKHILEALEHGIVLRAISSRLEEYDGEVYWLPLKDELKDWREWVGSWALSKIGTPYDYRSLFKNMLGKVSANANKLFCSEFVYMAYRTEFIRRLKLKADNAGEKLPPQKNEKIFNFKKAPRPAGILKMNIWKRPIRIY